MRCSCGGAVIAAIVAVITMTATVLAQTAQLTGRITDATSAVLPGAVITVTNKATGLHREVVSDERGYYAVPFLTPGTYRVSIERPGFRPATREDLLLSVDEVARVDVELQIAAVQQAIHVGTPISPLHRQTSSLGQVVDHATMLSLPVNGRSYTQFVLLSAGAVAHASSRVRTDAADLNGNRALQNTYLVDGLDNNNYLTGLGTGSTQTIRPSLEAIQEFRVETGGYGAEYGHAAGGLISVITRSGSNAFHGSGFEFLGDARLEANDFFAKRAGQPKPPLRYHQFGGTIGGPVVQNRAFFFGSYQGTRERRTYTATATVPTAAMVLGQFGSTDIYDPLTVVNNVRQPFANNTIPADRLDSVGQRIAALFPEPNREGTANNFVGPVPRIDDRDQIDARVDHRLTGRSTLFARYSWSGGQVRQESLFDPPGNGSANVTALGERLGFPLINALDAWSFVTGHTQVFSNTVVNELRAGFSANRNDLTNLADRPLIEEMGLKGIPLVPGLTGLPSFDITGFGALGDRTMLPSHPRARVLHISDSLSWARGSHMLKLGGEARYKGNAVENLQQGRGEFTFTGQFTSQVPGRGIGSGLADLLLGLPSTARLSTPLTGNLRDDYYAAYISDGWKVASDVTLTLGVRYEVQTPMWERHNRMTNFEAGPASAPVGSLVPARPGDLRARSFSKVDRNNVAPRLGLAWQVSPKTTLRGAYGVFYGSLGFQAAVLSSLANAPYFVRVAQRSTPIAPALVLADGFPDDVLNPARVVNPDAFATAPDLPLGKVHQWNLGIERELAGRITLSTTYVGSDSSQLRGLNNINAIVPGVSGRPFSGFGDILEASNFVEASYHALQVSAQRRFSDGVALVAHYTWGHAIDTLTDVSDTLTTFVPQNPKNIRAENASASFDVRHRFVTSVIYESPVGRKGNNDTGSRLATLLFGGWRLSGVFGAQTGYPLTPTLRPNSSMPNTPLRPDCIGDPNLPRGERSVDRWFDPAAFSTPPPLTFGNCGRNVIRGPGFVNLDLLLGREFRVGGDKRLEFRLEVFNAANAVHLGTPATVVDIPAPQPGQITSTQAPARQAHIAVRFVF